METINKFNKSMVYSIRTPHSELYYIGSTTQPLCKRFVNHKSKYKDYLNGTYGFVRSFKIIELGDAYIELMEEINCDNRNQLVKREGELIREHKANCVNMNIAGRSRKEWKTDNCDRIKKQMKQYRIDNSDKSKEYYLINKDKIREGQKEYRKQYYIDNSDKLKEYRLINSDKIKEYNKNYENNNKDKIKEQKKQHYAENKEKLKEKRRAKNAEQKLLKDLATITI